MFLHIIDISRVGIVAENMIKIIKEKSSGTVWISEDNKELFEYIPSRPTYKPASI